MSTDKPKQWTIQVTSSHIAAGIPGNPMRCPIANAMAEAGLENPGVHGRLAYFGPKQPFFTARNLGRMPDEAMRFQKQFDAGGPVQPFTFVLTECPQPSVMDHAEALSGEALIDQATKE